MNPALKVQKLSPKMKLALRALISGAAKGNADAAAFGGVTKEYVSMMKNTPMGAAFMAAEDAKMSTAVVEMSSLLRELGREATNRMAGLMRFSNDENIIFRASQDLMDRSGETQKVHKAQVESFSITGEDARAIASAMVEAARVKEQFKDVALEGLVRVEVDKKSEAA